MRFVVQEHHAKTHHFDFRLEQGGVLKSWAIPKGLPLEPGVRRLAIQVEDHELSFGDFEGRIPDNQYGAGEVRIWDSGTYETKEWTDNRILVTLSGRLVRGDYELIRFWRRGKKDWLIWKRGE